LTLEKEDFNKNIFEFWENYSEALIKKEVGEISEVKIRG
jgi:hypothetical protein